MAKLSIEQAPAPSTPRLFLLAASTWASAAGVLLALDGAVALVSRWGGPTLALVHALTLGFLGNAMFGSLLQFLPVAAGVRVRGGRAGAWVLFGLLNLGTLALVVSFRWPPAWPPWSGGALLAAAFALLGALVLPGVLRATGPRFLRWGLAGAVAGGMVTALLGLCLTLALSGLHALPVIALTDVHAAWGTLGWVMALLATVSRLVGPMFQGMAAPREQWQGTWQIAVYALLAIVAVAVLWGGSAPRWFRGGVGLAALLFAATGLILQARAPRLKKSPLTGFWAAGLAALVASAIVLLFSGSQAVLVGTLVFGIGLPLLVVGMQMEIVAFLGWIGLHRRCGRGIRLPGVQLLLPDRDKYRVLALHLIAAMALLAAAMAPGRAAHVAGMALMLAHGATLAALCNVTWRSRRFVRQMGRQP